MKNLEEEEEKKGTENKEKLIGKETELENFNPEIGAMEKKNK